VKPEGQRKKKDSKNAAKVSMLILLGYKVEVAQT
jgi:hypothetical protein